MHSIPKATKKSVYLLESKYEAVHWSEFHFFVLTLLCRADGLTRWTKTAIFVWSTVINREDGIYTKYLWSACRNEIYEHMNGIHKNCFDDNSEQCELIWLFKNETISKRTKFSPNFMPSYFSSKSRICSLQKTGNSRHESRHGWPYYRKCVNIIFSRSRICCIPAKHLRFSILCACVHLLNVCLQIRIQCERRLSETASCANYFFVPVPQVALKAQGEKSSWLLDWNKCFVCQTQNVNCL